MTIARTQSVDTGNNVAVISQAITISAPAAGSLIVTALGVDKDSGAITPPSGFTLIHDYVSANVSGAFAYKVSDGTETSITWTWVTARSRHVWAGVYTGLDATPFDVAQENNSGITAVTILSSGTTATTAQADELAIAVMASDTATSTFNLPTWSNSFATVSVGADSNRPGLEIAEKILTATGTVETTYGCTDIGDQMWVAVATFKAAASGTVKDLTAATLAAFSAKSPQNKLALTTTAATLAAFSAKTTQNRLNITATVAQLTATAQAVATNIATIIGLTLASLTFSAKTIQNKLALTFAAAQLTNAALSIATNVGVVKDVTAAALSFSAKTIQNKLALTFAAAQLTATAQAVTTTTGVIKDLTAASLGFTPLATGLLIAIGLGLAQLMSVGYAITAANAAALLYGAWHIRNPRHRM